MHSSKALIISAILLASCAATPTGPRSSSSSAASSVAVSSAASSTHPMIEATAPAANSTITSPVTITGRARGPWYFEASFPVSILNNSGTEIATGVAQAQGDWMTTDFVPFQVTIAFPATTGTGTIVLRKDNPSGEPANDDSISIPVTF